MREPKRIRIIRYWNIRLAEYVYGFEIVNSEGRVNSRHELDAGRNWAERTGIHFNVEVPDESESK